MTATEQLALASSKIEHWRGKVERSSALLHKWEKQLATLKAKGAKPVEPTAAKLPPLVIDPKVVPIEQAKAKGKAKPKKSKLRDQPARASFPPCPTLQRKAHANWSVDQECRMDEPTSD